MSTAILYMSRYGATAEYAKIIADTLGSDSLAIDLRQNKRPDLSSYDQLVIGVSIFAGRPLMGMSRLIERLKKDILTKRLGLFITCMYDGERAQEQLIQAYPEWLYAHANVKRPFGGRFTPEIMKPIDKWILKAASTSGPTASRFDERKAESFARELSELWQ